MQVRGGSVGQWEKPDSPWRVAAREATQNAAKPGCSPLPAFSDASGCEWGARRACSRGVGGVPGPCAGGRAAGTRQAANASTTAVPCSLPVPPFLSGGWVTGQGAGAPGVLQTGQPRRQACGAAEPVREREFSAAESPINEVGGEGLVGRGGHGGEVSGSYCKKGLRNAWRQVGAMQLLYSRAGGRAHMQGAQAHK